jgi:hypothetical protein
MAAEQGGAEQSEPAKAVIPDSLPGLWPADPAGVELDDALLRGSTDCTHSKK